MAQILSAPAKVDNIFDPYAMLAIMRRLSKIIEEEVALLKDMKIAQIHKLYDDKIELSSILESYKEVIAQNPEILNSIPKRVFEQMKAEAKKFELLVEEDNKQITRAKEVHKLVMAALKKALEQTAVKNSGYNKKGFIEAGYQGEYVVQPVSINEKI